MSDFFENNNDENENQQEQGFGFEAQNAPINEPSQNFEDVELADSTNENGDESTFENASEPDTFYAEPQQPAWQQPTAPEQPTGYGYNNQNNNQAQNTGYVPYGADKSAYYNRYGAPNSQYTNNNVPPYQNNQYGAPMAPMTPPPKKGGKVAVGIIVALVVFVAIIAIVSSLFGDLKFKINPSSSTSNSTVSPSSDVAAENAPSIEYSPTNPASISQLSAVQIAKKARKSVVGVMTYRGGQLSGEGSGVVMGMDTTGKFTYIITCAHVINDKGVTYGILTLDGTSYEATLVAADTRTDIGVLKVETTQLTPAEFGDSSTLEIGETVYAIGNPGGSEYFGSMTDGIISAIDRSVSSTYTMTCIQHNAAINPGNSGGALVNSSGQVIGINSSKIAATDFEGMGFAIPMSTVKSVTENLIKYKYVPNRPKLGIEYASVSSYQIYSMVVAIKGLPSGSLVIAGISNDSTLNGSDARVGDLIIGVNGKPMNDSSVLLDLIDTGAVGDSITLNLCRIENRTYKITKFDVTITLIEDKGASAEPTTSAPVPEGGYSYGGASSFEDFFKQYFEEYGF